jgi:hypothetical protein
MINRCLLFLLCLFLSPAGASELANILQKNAEAVGGSDNWLRVKNVRFLLDIREPGFEVSGTYVATRSGDMRIDIHADGQRVFTARACTRARPGNGGRNRDAPRLMASQLPPCVMELICPASFLPCNRYDPVARALN